MIYPDVNLERWCKRWGLKPVNRSCDKCGKVVWADRPFAHWRWRGLESREDTATPCGNSHSVLTAIELDEHGENFWQKTLKDL